MEPIMSESKYILYEQTAAVAVLSLNRVEARNAQNIPLLQELDAAFSRAVKDDSVRVIVLRANGPHFSAGHDIGPENNKLFAEAVDMESGVDSFYNWEQENYLGMTKRWRDLPKPTIAAVQGKCIAGGLMLCWPCDLILASEDASFSDPVVRMGVGGVEYHAHTWELGPRKAKELLFTAQAVSAQDAFRLGMVNHVVAREELDDRTMELAQRISEMDPFALKLAKQAVNRTLDTQGQWNAMQAVFDMHHLAHSHSRLQFAGNAISGMDVGKMKQG
jgi:enoyl-CoA hydratase